MELLKELPWTAILTTAVAVIACIAKFVFDKHVKPFLETRGLMEAAAIAVAAAEVAYGRGNGDEKLKFALEAMAKDGWAVDSDAVMNAIKAAWHDLNLKQIAAGVKEA